MFSNCSWMKKRILNGTISMSSFIIPPILLERIFIFQKNYSPFAITKMKTYFIRYFVSRTRSGISIWISKYWWFLMLRMSTWIVVPLEISFTWIFQFQYSWAIFRCANDFKRKFLNRRHKFIILLPISSWFFVFVISTYLFPLDRFKFHWRLIAVTPKVPWGFFYIKFCSFFD